mmetsp:Transcript_5460/g.11599  ORF Transcript_5460/g.11599 Transcript_5460/m.11599 type:complete len:97 (-) Transcript_5460:49-339(-)
MASIDSIQKGILEPPRSPTNRGKVFVEDKQYRIMSFCGWITNEWLIVLGLRHECRAKRSLSERLVLIKQEQTFHGRHKQSKYIIPSHDDSWPLLGR